MFIKLTKVTQTTTGYGVSLKVDSIQTDIWINTSHIITMYISGLTYVNTTHETIKVLETPEQIIALMSAE